MKTLNPREPQNQDKDLIKKARDILKKKKNWFKILSRLISIKWKNCVVVVKKKEVYVNAHSEIYKYF
jgi:hypothetical protein